MRNTATSENQFSGISSQGGSGFGGGFSGGVSSRIGTFATGGDFNGYSKAGDHIDSYSFANRDSGGSGGGSKWTGIGNPSFKSSYPQGNTANAFSGSRNSYSADLRDYPSFINNNTENTYVSPQVGTVAAPHDNSGIHRDSTPSHFGSSHWGAVTDTSDNDGNRGDTAQDKELHDASSDLESKIVNEITAHSGVKVIPTPQELSRFCNRCAGINSGTVAELLDEKLLSPIWQTRAKALHTIEALLKADFDSVRTYFTENDENVMQAASAVQDSVVKAARRVLRLLGKEIRTNATKQAAHYHANLRQRSSSSSSSSQQQQQQQREQEQGRSQQTEEILLDALIDDRNTIPPSNLPVASNKKHSDILHMFDSFDIADNAPQKQERAAPSVVGGHQRALTHNNMPQQRLPISNDNLLIELDEDVQKPQQPRSRASSIKTNNDSLESFLSGFSSNSDHHQQQQPMARQLPIETSMDNNPQPIHMYGAPYPYQAPPGYQVIVVPHGSVAQYPIGYPNYNAAAATGGGGGGYGVQGLPQTMPQMRVDRKKESIQKRQAEQGFDFINSSGAEKNEDVEEADSFAFVRDVMASKKL